MANILCVDDSLVIRRLLKKILETSGHNVTVAEDGEKAMDCVRNNHFDLILSDVNMPNMTGTGFVSKLRRIPEYEKTPVVMVTTESDGYKKEKLKSLGASGWLRKPFTEEQVNNILKRFFG